MWMVDDDCVLTRCDGEMLLPELMAMIGAISWSHVWRIHHDTAVDEMTLASIG